MALTLDTDIIIKAPPSRVWEVLTDLEAYPEWNPFVRSIEGDLAQGARLRVVLQPQGGKPMTFKPRIVALRPERELRWLGRLLVPGIFDGEHMFKLKPVEEGEATLFTHREDFGGFLASTLLARVGRATLAGFEAMNDALKERVEARA